MPRKCFWAGCVDCNVCYVEIHRGVDGCPHVSITCPITVSKIKEELEGFFTKLLASGLVLLYFHLL